MGFKNSISLGPVIRAANHFAARLFGRCFLCCLKSRARYCATVSGVQAIYFTENTQQRGKSPQTGA
jgi:hypothetical protein